MDIKDRIYIAPVRGRLPRHYPLIDEPTRRRQWRVLGFVCLACAAFWGAVWWWAAR